VGRGRRSHIDQAGYPQAECNAKLKNANGRGAVFQGQEPQRRPVRWQAAASGSESPVRALTQQAPQRGSDPPLLTGSGEQRRPLASAAGNSRWRET
jgi:hypothetical protein